MLFLIWWCLVGPLAWHVGAVCNRSSFTLPMIMNSGISFNALGNYDACLVVPGAHHCVLTVAAPLANVPNRSSPKHGAWLGDPLTLTGACVPSACSEAEIRTDVVSFLEHLSPDTARAAGLNVTDLLRGKDVDVTCSGNRQTLGSDVTACVMWGLVGTLGALVLLGTCLEVVAPKPVADSEPRWIRLMAQVWGGAGPVCRAVLQRAATPLIGYPSAPGR